MKVGLVLTFVLAALGAPTMICAGEPDLKGHTAASAALIANIRGGIEVLLAGTSFGCPNIESIAVGSVPNTFDLKSLPQVPATLMSPPREPVVYELWTINGCSRSAVIVVQLWRTDEGKDTFALSPLPKSAIGVS